MDNDDPDETYVERIAEIALEMDQALDFMKDVGVFLKEKTDVEILKGCEKQAQDIMDAHFDLLDDLNF